MTCDQFSDLYELYALGALEAEERVAFEQHLAEGCTQCRAEIRRAIELSEMILKATPRVQPSPQLRQRILAGFGQHTGRQRIWSWAFALAAAVLAIGLAVGTVMEHRAQTAASSELARMQNMLQILQASGTRQVTFGPAPTQAPHGSLLIHQKLGIVLIAGGLPAAPAGWNYESWLVPKTGAPRPIEPFQSKDGNAMSIIPGPLALGDFQAVAVSLEPSNAPVTKPTKVVFAAAMGS